MKMEMKMKTVFKSEQKISHSVKVISQVNVYNVTFSWDDHIEIWDFLFSFKDILGLLMLFGLFEWIPFKVDDLKFDKSGDESPFKGLLFLSLATKQLIFDETPLIGVGKESFCWSFLLIPVK